MRISWFLNKENDELVERSHLLNKQSYYLHSFSFCTNLEQDKITPFMSREDDIEETQDLDD